MRYGSGFCARELLTAAITLDAGGLASFSNDPIDKFIVAAARDAGATLVTADTAMLGWDGDVKRIDARV
jgi:PIN domain nuclease of toxin-antitoxin system